jgi:hypothetical protein
MSCFDIRDFSQLVDKASIYKECLKENAAEYTDQKRKTQGTGTSVGGVAKWMAVGSFSPQRPQGLLCQILSKLIDNNWYVLTRKCTRSKQ